MNFSAQPAASTEYAPSYGTGYGTGGGQPSVAQAEQSLQAARNQGGYKGGAAAQAAEQALAVARLRERDMAIGKELTDAGYLQHWYNSGAGKGRPVSSNDWGGWGNLGGPAQASNTYQQVLAYGKQTGDWAPMTSFMDQAQYGSRKYHRSGFMGTGISISPLGMMGLFAGGIGALSTAFPLAAGTGAVTSGAGAGVLNAATTAANTAGAGGLGAFGSNLATSTGGLVGSTSTAAAAGAGAGTSAFKAISKGIGAADKYLGDGPSVAPPGTDQAWNDIETPRDPLTDKELRKLQRTLSPPNGGTISKERMATVLANNRFKPDEIFVAVQNSAKANLQNRNKMALSKNGVGATNTSATGTGDRFNMGPDDRFDLQSRAIT